MLPDQLRQTAIWHLLKLEEVLQLALVCPTLKAPATCLNPQDMGASGVGAASHAAQDLVLYRLQSSLLGGIGMPHRGAIFYYWPDNSQQHDSFHIAVQALVPEDAPQHPLHPQALVLQDLSMLLPATVSTE